MIEFIKIGFVVMLGEFEYCSECFLMVEYILLVVLDLIGRISIVGCLVNDVMLVLIKFFVVMFDYFGGVGKIIGDIFFVLQLDCNSVVMIFL